MSRLVDPAFTIQCRAGGQLRFVYADELLALMKLGRPDIQRASHVEPSTAEPGKWRVDLSPVGGPVQDGFTTRAEALKHEVTWLNGQKTIPHPRDLE